MPVITHLRSDAMRERHIEAIVKEVKAGESKDELKKNVTKKKTDACYECNGT